METDRGTASPRRFRSLPGTVFPIYHVLADLGEMAGARSALIPADSSDPIRLTVLAMRRDGRSRLLLANYDDTPVPVRVNRLGEASEARVRSLDATTALQAMREPEAFRARAASPGRSQVERSRSRYRRSPW